MSVSPLEKKSFHLKGRLARAAVPPHDVPQGRQDSEVIFTLRADRRVEGAWPEDCWPVVSADCGQAFVPLCGALSPRRSHVCLGLTHGDRLSSSPCACRATTQHLALILCRTGWLRSSRHTQAPRPALLHSSNKNQA